MYPVPHKEVDVLSAGVECVGSPDCLILLSLGDVPHVQLATLLQLNLKQVMHTLGRQLHE